MEHGYRTAEQQYHEEEKTEDKEVTDGIELLKRRYLRNDPEMQKLIDEEFLKLEIGQQISDLEKLAQDLAPAVEMKLQWLRRALDEGEKDSADCRTTKSAP